MQSHCVCSCLCAMKWFFLASASEYSQWKCYYKRQQVVSAELMKMCDCSFRNGPTMWLTIPNERIIFTQQLALEWKSHPGRDEDAWNSGKQWEGKGVQRQLTAGEHFLFYLSFLLWAVPLWCCHICQAPSPSEAAFKERIQIFSGAIAVSWCKNSSQTKPREEMGAGPSCMKVHACVSSLRWDKYLILDRYPDIPHTCPRASFCFSSSCIFLSTKLTSVAHTFPLHCTLTYDE